MKTFIKIFLLIMLVLLLIFGVTISFGASTYSVSSDTTAETMLAKLTEGLKLTGISVEEKDQNKYLYCNSSRITLWTPAEYGLKNTIELPGSDENGHAKAYILAASGYDKYTGAAGADVTPDDERQYAWHCITETDGYKNAEKNDLYNIAIAYQNYMKEKTEFNVIDNSDGNTEQVGNNYVYGPIQITYSYDSYSGSKRSDKWGGFYYAFFDENDINVSDKIKICTLSNGVYTQINANKDDKLEGYYQVETSEYNNTNLYLVTSENNIGKVGFVIKENNVEYFAKIHEITGQYTKTDVGQTLCLSCLNKRSKAVSTLAEAVAGGVGTVYKKDGIYYQYNGVTGPEYKTSSTTVYNVYNVNGTTSNAGRAYYSTKYYCNLCKQNKKAYCTSHVSRDGNKYKVTCGCGYSYYQKSQATNHLSSKHNSIKTIYSKYTYNFSYLHCGGYASGKQGSCTGAVVKPGTYRSQDLIIVETANKNTDNNIEIDMEVQFKTSVEVTKVWHDNNNKYGTRPNSIEVKLLANGVDTGKKLTLNESNNWTARFEELDIRDNNGNEIAYTVQEMTDISPNGYEHKGITGSHKEGYKIINMLKIDVPVKKVWNDMDDLDEFRPDSILVKLLANGKDTGLKLTLTAPNWTDTFTDLDKCDLNGNVIEYTIQEFAIDRYDAPQYVPTEDPKTGDVTITITNTRTPIYAGYFEITGKVWLDRPDGKANQINGTLDEDESGLGGIKVILKDVNGKQFDVTSTAITADDGTYTIKVNYDNSKNVYKLYEDAEKVKEKLKTAYIEFEYVAMTYTTVATAVTGTDTSKAKENETTRNNFDNAHSTVTTSTTHPDTWTDKTITAITKDVISFETYADKTSKSRSEVVKYCNGDGKNTIRTNPDGAWKDILVSEVTCENCKGEGHSVRTFDVEVVTIQNVNLGLFEREQPKVGIFSDLTKVEVTMNNQKYTYLYGVRSKDFADVDIKTQFQNKDEYKYERPVNPADISYIQEPANSNAMSVFVTYEVEVGNLSTTLPITVNNIINVYDTGYKAPTITIGAETIEYTPSTIYGSKEERGFNEITLDKLGLTIQPGKRSEKIQIRYEVNKDEIIGLFNGNASLHNAVEIHTYSTTYGENTLYAEQGKGGRTDQAYGGYDYETHPGNAVIRKDIVEYEDKYNEGEKYPVEILISTENLVEYETGKFRPEHDTDISPAFILCKDVNNPKILAGTVFEDKDAVTTDSERLGDGKYDSATEKGIQNVKVELFEVKEDGSAVLANLYKDDGTAIPAVTYSDSNGNYSFGNNEEKYGVVTGEYFIKFTYGNDAKEDGTKELKYATKINGGTVDVNARNYKSTIITNPLIKKILNLDYENTEFDKNWHINIEDNYSIAVDNMKDRLEIEDLQNSNFYSGENMTAYSKPFMTQLEFESSGQSQVDSNGVVASTTLSKLDFGIIERPREDIFIQKRVTNLKITLANGQVLTEGNPSEQTLNYVKSMGQGQIFENSADARDFERRILVEIDKELIQGSRLEVEYEVVVKNNNEKDYDYGTETDYDDIKDNNYITKNKNADYYYYGIPYEEQAELKTTIEIVDYLSNEVVYDESGEGDAIAWEEKTASDLKGNGLISNDTSKALEEGKNYKIFKLASNDGKITLARGEFSDKFTMSASKLLANKDENIYDNHTEIIKIDAKSARTIGVNKEGEIIEKTYIPGDYVPTLDADGVGERNKQQDDDKVPVILTNSTGITVYIITYLITGLIGLIVLVVVIVIIKKVLSKK